MISRNHYIIHDIMGVNISTDIICLRYHENDIKDCNLWYHDCHIRIWFHGIITSYKKSWVQISVLISQSYFMSSYHHLIWMHAVWCHDMMSLYDVIDYALDVMLWNQFMKPYIYELHSRARAGQQPFSGVAVYSKSGAEPPIGPSSPESFASSSSSDPTELFLALGASTA